VDGDTYVFLLGGDLDAFAAARKDFLALTGPVPELPDFAFGTWFTFWHAYSEDEAKADIQRWETLQLPLDVWGLDINWRGVNCDGPGCTGPSDTPYQCDYNHPDTSKFPDFDGWFAWLSEHKLRTYHNDHPCAQGPQAGAEETSYRYAGLSKWLGKGMTFWWFDLNWMWSIPPPFRGSEKEDWDGLDTSVWGSHVFYTSTAYFNEHVREPRGTDYGSATIALSKSFKPDWQAGMPAIHGAEHPAHHRYPVHWTGDFVTLQASVESMVDSGVHSFKPFVHSDCGGDYGQSQGDPGDVTSAAGLLRWTGHCAYGSILRFHGADHRVWQYDEATQQAFKSFLDARYRLLPSIKAAAKRASEEGHPLVARLDLFHAEYPEAADNSQYLFLDDILVAPIFVGKENSRQVWVPPGDWQDAWDPSKVLTGPTTVTVQQPSERIPMWHRRDGGLLVLAPESTRVDSQDWSLLSLEAFPSSKAWNSSRRLHEAAGCTEIKMRSDGHGRVSIHIGEAPSSRAWVVRVHLRPQQRLSHAAVDGVAVASLAGLHLEADNARYFPLLGAGTSLPPGAGAVAELRLEPAAHARSVEVNIQEPVVLV
jgi:alpha-glucosidase (family GH31 glycosyl hydrolase)